MSTEREREKEGKKQVVAALCYALAFLGLALATVLPQLLLLSLLSFLFRLVNGRR